MSAHSPRAAQQAASNLIVSSPGAQPAPSPAPSPPMASALHQKSEYDELHRLMVYADAQLKPRAAALLQRWEQQTSGLAPPPTAWSARAFQDAIVEFHDVRERARFALCSSTLSVIFGLR